MKQIYLTQEQMKHLEDLGLQITNASIYRSYDDMYGTYEGEYVNTDGSLHPSEDCKPMFTLEDILDILPNQIKCEQDKIGIATLEMNKMAGGGYHLMYEYSPDGTHIKALHHSQHNESALLAAYDMLVWLLENKYLIL